MLGDLEKASALGGATAIWSQWEGYLSEGSGKKLRELLNELGVPLTLIHTSGHASIPDLKRLAVALAPREIVTFHTFVVSQFPRLFSNVTIRNDGEWWEIGGTPNGDG
jgi:ribonuclease J